MPARLRHTRSHDYGYLVRRWRTVARSTGLIMRKFAEAGGNDLYFFRSRKIRNDVPSIYISAGIHGDESAATEGLLAWAERNPELLGKLNFLIFPCLNPWGLIANSRYDSEGRDLNRSYHSSKVPQIAQQMALFSDHAFDLALMLHEDYDGQGVYIYEVTGKKPYWAEELLKAASKHIAPDPRSKIEGRSARHGVVRRKVTPDMMPEWPEAFVLCFQNVARVFTVETPSEFHLDDRIEAQVALVDRAVKLVQKEFSLPNRPVEA